MRTRFLAPAALLLGATTLAATGGSTSVTTEPIAVNPARPTTSSLPAETRTAALEVYGWIVGMQSSLLWGFSDEEAEDIIRGLRKARTPDTEPPPSLEGLLPIAQAIVNERRQELEAAAEARGAEEAAGKADANTAYFAELAQREGVKKTESGLHYEVLEPGIGRTPGEDDTVRLHYHGTLTNGEVFDSSRERGEPTEFPVRGVIPGFSEGIRQIREGGKVRLHIPPELGYGNRPTGRIPAGSILIFEVELLEVLAP